MAEKSFARGLVVSVPALAILGALSLSLLGYGAASAIEGLFGVPAELTYDSPLDLLHLSNHAILGLVDKVSNLHTSVGFKKVAAMAAGIGLATALFLIVLRRFNARKTSTNARSGIVLALSRIPDRQPVEKGLAWLRKERSSLALFALLGLLPWLFIPIAILLLLLFAALPLLGYWGATEHLQTWIVSAEHCSPVTGRNERLILARLPNVPAEQEKEHKITPCLALWKNGSMVAQGRHIASTSSTIILFDPVSGNVLIEPTDGSSIRLNGLSAITLKEAMETPFLDD